MREAPDLFEWGTAGTMMPMADEHTTPGASEPTREAPHADPVSDTHPPPVHKTRPAPGNDTNYAPSDNTNPTPTNNTNEAPTENTSAIQTAASSITMTSPPVRAWRLFLAPWRFLTAPSVAGPVFANARRGAFWIVYVAYAGLFATLMLGWIVAERVVTYETHQVLLPPGSTADPWKVETVVNDPAELWEHTHPDGFPGAFEAMFVMMMVIPLALNVLMAWMCLGDVHRYGSMWRSYKQAFRTIASGMVLVCLLVLVCGAAIVVPPDIQIILRSRGGGLPPGFGNPLLNFLPPVVCMASCVVLVNWVGRAVRTVGDTVPIPDVLDRCEGCGYDLTHSALSGRCSECGLPVRESIPSPDDERPHACVGCGRLIGKVPDDSRCPHCRDTIEPVTGGSRRRPGWAWQRTALFRNFVELTCRLILRPTETYSELRLQTDPAPARRFVRWHFITMAGTAMLWMSLILQQLTGNLAFDWIGPMILGITAICLAGWLILRGINALAFSAWLYNRTFPDFGWYRHVAAYESAALWVFCLYNGAFLTSLAMFDDWVGRWFGEAFFQDVFDMKPFAVVIIYGNGLLLLLWLFRHARIARAIRYSNH